MSIKINRTSTDNYQVNDKPIYKDMNGNYVAPITLTALELQAFHKHLISENREATDTKANNLVD